MKRIYGIADYVILIIVGIIVVSLSAEENNFYKLFMYKSYSYVKNLIKFETFASICAVCSIIVPYLILKGSLECGIFIIQKMKK